jgi:hypothetical protein
MYYQDRGIKTGAACKRDIESDIIRAQESYMVTNDLKEALEAFWSIKGKPQGQEGTVPLAFYGQLCLKAQEYKHRLARLMQEQEAESK